MSIGQIQWEKWEDPLLVRRDETDEGSDDVDDLPKRNGIVLMSPDGAMPFQERTCVSRYYNFWVGHTDFKITVGDSKKIKKINGVEALNFPSRHRFRIAVGAAFDEWDVKRRVSALFFPPKNKGPRSVADILGDSLSKKWKYWAVIKGLDGRLSSFGSNKQDDVNAKLVRLEGNLEVIRSWD